MTELSAATQSPNWLLVASAVPQRSLWGKLLSVFINYLDDGREWTPIRFGDSISLVGAVSILAGRVAVQGEIDRLEK